MQPTQIFDQLADAGLSLSQAVAFTDQLLARHRKRAGAIADVLKSSTPLAYGVIGGPPILGYLAGKSLAGTMDVTDDSIQELQERELIDELIHNAEAIKRRRSLRGNPETKVASVADVRSLLRQRLTGAG